MGAVPPVAGPGQYTLIQCNRSIQDSYGWIGAFYGGDGRPITANCTDGDACPRVVAAMNVFSAPATRWCALHNIQMIPNNPLIGLNFQQLHDFSGALGAAPMATKLSTAIAPGDTKITVDGEPLSLATAGDPVRQDAAVGDVFIIGTNPSESVRITAISQACRRPAHLDSYPRQPGEGISRRHRRVGGLQSGISPDLLEVPQRPARAGHHEQECGDR